MSQFVSEPAVLLTIGLVLVVLASTVLLLLNDDAKALRRRFWAARLQRTLWGQRLRDSQVDLLAYTASRSSADLHREIRNCRACTNKLRCVQALLIGEPSSHYDAFCRHQRLYDHVVFGTPLQLR